MAEEDSPTLRKLGDAEPKSKLPKIQMTEAKPEKPHSIPPSPPSKSPDFWEGYDEGYKEGKAGKKPRAH